MGGVIYQDEDTGELIGPDHPNYNDYEPASGGDMLSSAEDPSWWDYASGIPSAVTTSMMSGAAGVGQGLFDLFGRSGAADLFSDYGSEAASMFADELGKMSQEYQGRREDALAPLNLEPGTVRSGVVNTAVSMLPALASRNPMDVAKLFGVNTFGEDYNFGRTSGLEPSAAVGPAAADAALQAGMGMLPFKAASAPGLSFAKRAGMFSLFGAGTGAPSAAGSVYLRGLLNGDAEDPGMQDYLNPMIESTVGSVLMSPLAAHTAGRMSRRPQISTNDPALANIQKAVAEGALSQTPDPLPPTFDPTLEQVPGEVSVDPFQDGAPPPELDMELPPEPDLNAVLGEDPVVPAPAEEQGMSQRLLAEMEAGREQPIMEPEDTFVAPREPADPVIAKAIEDPILAKALAEDPAVPTQETVLKEQAKALGDEAITAKATADAQAREIVAAKRTKALQAQTAKDPKAVEVKPVMESQEVIAATKQAALGDDPTKALAKPIAVSPEGGESVTKNLAKRSAVKRAAREASQKVADAEATKTAMAEARKQKEISAVDVPDAAPLTTKRKARAAKTLAVAKREGLIGKLGREDGWIRLGRAERKDAVAEMLKALPDLNQTGDIIEMANGPDQDYFNGSFDENAKSASKAVSAKIVNKIMRAKLPGDSSVGRVSLGLIRKSLVFPRTLARKFPEFKPYFDYAMRLAGGIHARTYDWTNGVADYYALNSEEMRRVDSFLHAAREQGAKLKITPELLTKAGLTSREQAAVAGVRQTMDSIFTDLEQSFIKRIDPALPPEHQAAARYQIQQKFAQMKQENYIPKSRFGKYAVTVTDANGDTTFHSQHETKAEQKLAAEGLKAKGYEVTLGEMSNAPEFSKDGLPLDMAMALGKLDPTAMKDFVKLVGKGISLSHFNKANLTPGAEPQLRRPLSDYIVKMANYSARKASGLTLERLKDPRTAPVNPSKQGDLYSYAMRYLSDIEQNKMPWKTVNKVITSMMMGFNVKSMAVNATQPYVVTLPYLLEQHGAKAPLIFADATAKATKLMYNKEALKGTWQEPYYKHAQRIGTLSDEAVAFVMGESAGRPGGQKDIFELSMAGHSFVEKFNRTHAFVAGLESAKQLGLTSPKDILAHATEAVHDTQFVYGLANKPRIANVPVGAQAMLFKTYMGNYLRLMRDWAGRGSVTNPGPWAALGSSLAAGMSLGGMRALPFATDAQKVLEELDIDPEEVLVKQFGQRAGTAMYRGLPAEAIGFDLSGPLGWGQNVPDLDGKGGWTNAAARILLGAAYDVPSRLERGAKYFAKGDPRRGVETLMPELIRGPMVASRATKSLGEGNWKDMKGRDLIKGGPTPGEIVGRALNFSPTRLNRGYKLFQRIDAEKQDYSQRNAGLADRFAEAMANNDADAQRQVMEEIVNSYKENPTDPTKQKSLNDDTVDKQFATRKFGALGELMNAPDALAPRIKELIDLWGG